MRRYDMSLSVSQPMCLLVHRVWMCAWCLRHPVSQLCHRIRFWRQNRKIGSQECNDIQTSTLPKKPLCDRAFLYTVGSSLLVAMLITDGRFPLGQIGTYWPRAKAEAAVADEEFVGPFPSWSNVKTMYGAAGDGVTDDTVHLQNALNDLGQTGRSVVLYLPAGT